MTNSVRMKARSVAVVYLARGADANPMTRFHRFVESYRAHNPGLDHKLFVIFKGFSNADVLSKATDLFLEVDYNSIETDDNNFDVGAYAIAAASIDCDDICFLNSNSEIMGRDWLAKLAMAHRQPGMGMVCATGSYETLWPLIMSVPKFPNVHARSNAFMLSRARALQILPARVPDKKSAYALESGIDSITRRLFQAGLAVEVVGRDGRSYPPQWWPASGTFRQGCQENLLVHDNQTRVYERLPWPDKHALHIKTWGHYAREGQPFILPSNW